MEATNIFAKLATKYEAGFDDFLPKRVQILAKGFAEGWDLVRVNEKLLEEECETLYARSFFEAGLIFAYDHGMSYPEWRSCLHAVWRSMMIGWRAVALRVGRFPCNS